MNISWVCFFIFTLEHTCNTRSAPKNGALACFEAISTYCNPFCQDGYEFSYKPEGTYFCYRGAWQYWTGSFQVLISARQEWPDCVGKCLLYIYIYILYHLTSLQGQGHHNSVCQCGPILPNSFMNFPCAWEETGTPKENRFLSA